MEGPQNPIPQEEGRSETFKLEEIENLVKEAGGKIKENNGRAVLAHFTTGQKVENFDDLMQDVNKIPELIIAEYCARPIDLEDDSLERKAKPTIESVIGYVLYRYKKMSAQYKEWRKNLENTETKEINYIDMSLKSGIEGGSENSNSESIYISPRFLRVEELTGKPFFNIVGGANIVGSRANLYGLPKKLAQEIMDNHNEWLTIMRLSKFNEYVRNKDVVLEDESQKKTIFNQALSTLQSEGSQEMKNMIEASRSSGEVEDWNDEQMREKIVSDFRNYLGFLDRCYEALGRFIAVIEQYK